MHIPKNSVKSISNAFSNAYIPNVSYRRKCWKEELCTRDAIKLLVRNSSKKIESRLLEVVEFERMYLLSLS